MKILQSPKVSDVYNEVFSIWAPKICQGVASQPRASLCSILFLFRSLVFKLSVFTVLCKVLLPKNLSLLSLLRNIILKDKTPGHTWCAAKANRFLRYNNREELLWSNHRWNIASVATSAPTFSPSRSVVLIIPRKICHTWCF